MKVQVRHLAMLVAGILALMLVSCDDGDSATSFDASINQADICEEIAEVMCHNMFDCCTGKDRENVLGEELTRTEGECVDDMILHCEAVGAEWIQAAETETVSFDMEAAKACVEALVLPDDSNCVAVQREDTVAELCINELYVSGLVAKDGDCFWDWECDGDAYCGFDFTCRDLPTDGETCNFDSEAPSSCAAGHMCINNMCEELAADGDDCANDMDCGAELYCDDIDTDASLTCTSHLAGGESCSENKMCETRDCRTGFCDILTTAGCMDDSGCGDICEGTASTTFCDAQADDCPMLCTGDMATFCVDDTNCTTAGGTCAKPACLTQSCIDGGVCEFGSLSEIDYCEEGRYAPCTVFGLSDFECSF